MQFQHYGTMKFYGQIQGPSVPTMNRKRRMGGKSEGGSNEEKKIAPHLKLYYGERIKKNEEKEAIK